MGNDGLCARAISNYLHCSIYLVRRRRVPSNNRSLASQDGADYVTRHVFFTKNRKESVVISNTDLKAVSTFRKRINPTCHRSILVVVDALLS